MSEVTKEQVKKSKVNFSFAPGNCLVVLLARTLCLEVPVWVYVEETHALPSPWMSYDSHKGYTNSE